MQSLFDEAWISEIESFKQAFSNCEDILPGFSLAIKTTWLNLFGINEEILLVGQVSLSEKKIPDPKHWSLLRLEPIRKLIQLPTLSPTLLAEGIRNSLAHDSSPKTSPTILCHGALSAKYTCYCEPTVLMAIFCSQDAQNMLAGLYKETALVLESQSNFHLLCKDIAKQAVGHKSFILTKRGLLLGGKDISACRQSYQDLVRIASNSFNLPKNNLFASNKHNPTNKNVNRLRYQLSEAQGRPLVLHLDNSKEAIEFSLTKDCVAFAKLGLPSHTIQALTGTPLVLDEEIDDDSENTISPSPDSSIILKPGLGIIAAGRSKSEAEQVSASFHAAAEAIRIAYQNGILDTLHSADIQRTVDWEGLFESSPSVFSGEIGLVTGAASGIGKAIVDSLLDRGCSVVGLDINPSIKTTFDNPNYLGLICDVSDENQVIRAFKTIENKLGGLDILILNAGLFPGGCNIEKLTLEEFMKVINVNFVSNMVIMREAYPLLCLAPRYGRMIIIGSRNFRAPGPGAAAYSSSKAALIQLARVATLEWAKDKIRVNIVHPDSVFDTALYSDEILLARSKHYGMTIEQYKKRNLLKTEITSHDVAEVTAVLCSPIFQSMTGGQIQLDGGNERTI